MPDPLQTIRESSGRLQALRSLGLLDVAADEGFDRLTRVARSLLDVPAAFISLVDADHDFYLSHCGFGEPLASTRRLEGETFCHHAIASSGPLVIPDTRADPRYREIPTVESLGVAAYVGVPIRLPSGEVVGSFCVVDTAPRAWTEREVQVLQELAASTLTEIELRRSAQAAASERLAAEAARQQYADLVNGLDAIVWEMDARSWRFTFVSRQAEALLGYPVERWLQEEEFWSRTVLHPDDREWATERCVTATAEGRDHELDYRAVAADGRVVWLHDRVRVVCDESGSAILLRGMMFDITGRRRVDEELRVRTAELEQLFECAPEAIVLLDEAERVVRINPEFTRIFGYEAEEALGRHLNTLIAPPSLLHQAAELTERVARGEKISFQAPRRRKDGSEISVSIVGAPIRLDGERRGVLGIYRDVTEERARTERMHLLTAALDNLREGVSVTRADRHNLYANRAFAKNLGIAPGTENDHSIEEFLPDEAARQQLQEIREALHRDGSWSGRVWRRQRDGGEVIPLDVLAGTVPGLNGETLTFTISHDAREAIERERRLRRTERLASLGTLVGGVAHELNNPLHAIRSFAELMLLEDAEGSDREALEIIKREADRAAKIVSDLRLIARQTQEGERTRAAVDLNEVVRHILKVRRYALETGNVEVREHLDEGLPLIAASRADIEQVVLNLIVNAEQAMTASDGERRLVLRTRATPDSVALSVEDTGTGIPSAHLERVFDPFFTTKAPGEGTGLGLSLVHSIVAEHGGSIRVESETGRGSAFGVDFPRFPAPRPEPEKAAAPAAAARSLRVLVVDDEAAVRRVSTLFLERRGHRVDSAREGEEALRLTQEAQYDAIVSDLRMPGMGGDQLLRRLRQQGGGLDRRLIFLTGDAASHDAAELLASSAVPVLMKPVQLEELARAVETVALQERATVP